MTTSRLIEETEKLKEAITLYREEQEKNRILTEKYETLNEVKGQESS
jgi:hypothetical protein